MSIVADRGSVERQIQEGEARIARSLAIIENLTRAGHLSVASLVRGLLASEQQALTSKREFLRRQMA
jgi:hypothetical protein